MSDQTRSPARLIFRVRVGLACPALPCSAVSTKAHFYEDGAGGEEEEEGGDGGGGGVWEEEEE